MSRLRKHLIGVLAAATIAAASLAAPPPASAMPMSCATRLTLSYMFSATGDAFYLAHQYVTAAYWYGRAESVLTGC